MRLPLWFLALFTAVALPLVSPDVLHAQVAPAAPAGTEKEAPPKIEGIEVRRAGGGYLGIQTQGVTLRVTFYDKDKKKVAADAVRISARWRDGKPRFAVLLPSSADTLVSPGVFQRPFNYVVYLTLMSPDDAVIETHSLMLAGSDQG